VKHVLVTGAAGFIGFHLSRRLLDEGVKVTGIDNLNDYYDVSLKEARLERIKGHKNFSFRRLDLEDREGMDELFSSSPFDAVVHLAAQAGVRYSLENPHSYVQSNIVGFLHVLEGCKKSGVKHLVFASSSSVYGANTRLPFSVHQNVDHPVSLYAATKKAGELMAHTYAVLYNLPCTGLRFFTVYGPWGRPDMAYFKFAREIMEGKPISVYNYGKMKRDFTYIDDIVEGVARVMEKVPHGRKGLKELPTDPSRSSAPYRIYNFGNNNPVNLLDFIEILEEELGKKAEKKFFPLQPGDMEETFADISEAARDIGYTPCTTIAEGLKKFVAWFKEYYKLS
jgi:UDP-glucuronate 4-epimerase